MKAQFLKKCYGKYGGPIDDEVITDSCTKLQKGSQRLACPYANGIFIL
jgi:hypothetical protein